MNKLTLGTAFAIALSAMAGAAMAYSGPSGNVRPSVSSGPANIKVPSTVSPTQGLQIPSRPGSAGTVGPRLVPPAGPLTAPPRPYEVRPGTLAPNAPLTLPHGIRPTAPTLPNLPAPVPQAKGGGFIAPTPDGFVGGGVTPGGHGGVFRHQDHGGGHKTNGGLYISPKGDSFGGSITTGPGGSAIGGLYASPKGDSFGGSITTGPGGNAIGGAVTGQTSF